MAKATNKNQNLSELEDGPEIKIKKHEETRKVKDFSCGTKRKCKIKNNSYELDNDGVKTTYLKLSEEIEEDEFNSVLTCNGVSVRFCPRGYYVNEIYCPLAEVAFAVQKENPGSNIIIYDEVS